MERADAILKVNDLVTSFATEEGTARAVSGVSFEVKKGKTLGLVGESGCGKSVSALSVMRLLPKPAGNIDSGEILFDGKDVVKLPASEMHHIRGKRISMIFQEPMTALNPVHRIGKQLAEVFELHFPKMTSQEILKECIDLLNRVGIPEPQKRLMEFPHQLSGGMRQRVVIAIALACKPDILIADEPTTALDVTIQAQILDLMRDLQREYGMAIIFITHDLGVVAEMCDDVAVMYGGMIVESAPVVESFKNPKHPYTKGLLESIPRPECEHKSELKIIEGMVPSIFEMPVGCRFENRCPYTKKTCKKDIPVWEEAGKGHHVRCFRWKEIDE